MLPYVAVMVSWSVHRIGRRPILVLAIAASAVQLAVVQAVAFDLVPNMLKHDVVGLVPLRTIDRHGQQARVLEGLVSRTCHEEGARKYLNIVAIDPNLQGDWLAPEPANYVAERNLVKRSRQPACEYGYVGRSFFGAPAADAWQMLIDDSVRYVITIDPAMYQPPADAVNETLKPESFRLLWTNLTTTGFFEREPPLTADPGIVVFRRLNDLGRGRALSDRGAHEQAIVILRGVAAAEPSNVEAWANLALALERAGQFDEAIRAGLRARSLDPKHYYVNLGLARSLFSVGNAVRGCDYLRTAGEQQTTPDILSQMASHGCEK
jgi:tetratricopeptide (TPR) repeat protein